MSRVVNYVRASISAILAQASTSEGRNNGLNKLAFSLGQFIDQGITQESAEQICMDHAAQWGLDHRESQATIKSGLSAGMQNPRDLSALVPHMLATQAPFKAKNALSSTIMETEAPSYRIARALRAIWDALKDHPIHGFTGQYPLFMNKRKLRWRDMKEATAFELHPMRDALVKETLNAMVGNFDLTQEEALEIGWLTERGSSWVPLKAHGFLVPMWSPAWTDAPVAYRMRLFNYERVGLPKCISMTTPPPWRDIPIIHPLSLNTMGGTLVILEGEPDYLTMALPLINAGCSVIALPGSFWRPAWNYLLKSRSKVVFAAHQDEAGHAVAKKVGRLCTQYKVSCAARFPVYGDWSDARQAGTDTQFLVDYILGG